MILSIWNLDSKQQNVLSWLPVVSAGAGASKMPSALTSLESQQEGLIQLRIIRKVRKGLSSQVLNVRSMKL